MKRLTFNRVLAVNIDIFIVIILVFLGEYYISKSCANYLDFVVPILYLFGFLYFFSFEYFLNKTIGKFLMGLEVEYENKNIYNSLIRTISRIYPFDWVSYFINKNEDRMIHDKLSKTKVIQKESNFW